MEEHTTIIEQPSRGLFIVLEGGEGVGKTTQAKMLVERLWREGHDVLLTKQPGGSEGICRRIRELLLDRRYLGTFSPVAELLLYLADKAQHIQEVIVPALEKGKIVVCDRYVGVTFSYQHYVRQVCSREEFDFLLSFATKRLQPDYTYWFDLDPEVGLRRNSKIEEQQTRFEDEGLHFHTRAREGFHEFFSNYCHPEKWRKIDASRSVDELHAELVNHITALISAR
jgi:dTMP kinase